MIRLRRLVAHNFKQLADVNLELPTKGRFLIRGLNEAGKSTLFEAVYFGLFSRPLSGGAGQAKLDDLVRYRQDEALVQLEVELDDGRRLDIVRRIRRQKTNVWELDIHRPDGSIETVRANSPVNQRIEDELQLDGEALLNTCFVEQKKLDKLEGQSRSQREESLMRLLNLDPLVSLTDELKPRSADQSAVQRLRDRLRLAELGEELPKLETQLGVVSARLAALDRYEAADLALAAAKRAEADLTALSDAEKEEHALAERAAAAEQLAQALGRLSAAQADRARLADLRRAADLTADRIQAAGEAAASIPQTMARGRRLRAAQERDLRLRNMAATATEWAAEVADQDRQLAALASAREVLNGVRQALVTARSEIHDASRDLEVLEGDRRAIEIRSALEDWKVSAVDGALPEPPADQRAQLRAQHQALEQSTRIRGGSALGVALVLALGAAWQASARSALAGPLAVLATVVAIGALIYAARSWRRQVDVQLALARLEGDLARRQHERDQVEERREALRHRLIELNAVPPADLERAEQVLVELNARLGSRRRDDIESALLAAQQVIARARAEESQLIQREAQLRRDFGAVDGAALGRRRDALEARSGRLARIVDERSSALLERLKSLGVDDAHQIGLELGALRQQLTTARETVAHAASLAAEHEQQLATASALASKLSATWTALSQASLAGNLGSASLGTATAPGDLPAEIDEPDDAAWTGLQQRLEAAFAAAGGDEVRRQLAAATRTTAERRERARQSGGEAQAATERLARMLAQGSGGQAKVVGRSATELATLAEGLKPPAGESRVLLESERDRLAERRSIASHERQQLARQLGLDGEVVDVEAARAELLAAERTLAVRERASRLVSQASRNVMQSVLPNTLAYMTRLLPALTDQRYRDAKLSDDYRIEVYDERAGDWRTKNLFSGGTKDQFSLALRLSFALATLPEERGTAPGFLFLDEPLGAFDSERARALVELLTEGELASSFDQIFLISHVPVEESLFDYTIRLDDGQVVESNL